MKRLPKPRISKTHYTIAQMRNLTRTYVKELGFWLGTYNEGWFRRYMNSEMEKQYWGERELAYTAIANGSDYIISPSDYMGYNLPVDQNHWDEYVKGMEIIQKVGSDIVKAPKVKANACFIFPRTQYLLLQEEYYNVGLSYELFLRAFGELDILHEDQITDETLNGYKVLVLCDVKLLPEGVAKNIEKFVTNEGVVIADCVPQINGLRSNSKEAYVFVINHESTNPKTEITLAELNSGVKRIIDIESDKPVSFKNESGKVKFAVDAPWGKTKLLKVIY